MPPKSSSKRRFELVEGPSKKFWEIATSGSSVSVTFGRIGTSGVTKDKTLSGAADAQREAAKLIREKTAKGYKEVTAAKRSGGAPAVKGPAQATAAGPVGAMLEAIRGKFKALYGQLRSPAKPDALEALRRLQAPPMLVGLYAAHDGIDDEHFLGGFGLLPVSGVLSERKMMNGLLAKSAKWKASSWWCGSWVPFLSDRGGQLYCFDPVGALEGGKPGQIVFFDHEAGPRIELGSFAIFVELVTTLAKKGVLLDPDSDRFVEIYDNAKSVGAAVMPAKERKAADARFWKLSDAGNDDQALALVLPLATRYAADAELWTDVVYAATALERWDVAAPAAAARLRLTTPSQRYGKCADLVHALHMLGRDDDAIKALSPILKDASPATRSLTIPGHNQREEFAANPKTAAFQRRCLALWTELHPNEVEAWLARATAATAHAERKLCVAKTVEACDAELARGGYRDEWVRKTKKAASQLLKS